MQTKKDKVRQALLEEAEKEFLHKGFINASVRKIVKHAGTTIGNFYNYFDNKETLFEELVRDEYRNLIFFMENHDKADKPSYLRDASNIREWREALSVFIQEIMPVFSDRLIILLEGSRGTKYENTYGELVTLVKEHFLEHTHHMDDERVDADLAEIIAEQFLNGVLLVLKKHGNTYKRKHLLAEHFMFYFTGIAGLLGGRE